VKSADFFPKFGKNGFSNTLNLGDILPTFPTFWEKDFTLNQSDISPPAYPH
jgi:hypothetical protein